MPTKVEAFLIALLIFASIVVVYIIGQSFNWTLK